MDNPSRCQVSVEFMIILGVVLMVFIMLGYVVYMTYVKSSDLKTYMYGVRLANTVADNINTVNALQEGYSTHFELPPRLHGGSNYTVRFYGNESSVFMEGSSFASGSPLTYSSPISTSRVHCILAECNFSCNRTATEECLQVKDMMRIRLAKYAGGIYLTPEANVIQGGMSALIVPYEGEGDIDPNAPGPYVKEGGEVWDVIYVYRNRADDSLSLAFSMNLTGGNNARMNFHDVIGKVVDVKSNDNSPVLELNLDAEPEALWEQAAPEGDLDGGVIKFADGFRICISTNELTMPPQDWMVLSSDGNHIKLEKGVEVCITYP